MTNSGCKWRNPILGTSHLLHHIRPSFRTDNSATLVLRESVAQEENYRHLNWDDGIGIGTHWHGLRKGYPWQLNLGLLLIFPNKWFFCFEISNGISYGKSFPDKSQSSFDSP